MGVDFTTILGFGVLCLAFILFALLSHRRTLLGQTPRLLLLLSLCAVSVLILFLGNLVAYEQLKKIIGIHFDILEIKTFTEMEKNDSIYVVLKNI